MSGGQGTEQSQQGHHALSDSSLEATRDPSPTPRKTDVGASASGPPEHLFQHPGLRPLRRQAPESPISASTRAIRPPALLCGRLRSEPPAPARAQPRAACRPLGAGDSRRPPSARAGTTPPPLLSALRESGSVFLWKHRHRDAVKATDGKNAGSFKLGAA